METLNENNENNNCYDFEYGKEINSIPFFNTTPINPINHLKNPYSLFIGHCFYCDYDKHSQNYCPIKCCIICGKYGHSAKVCFCRHQTNNTNECHLSLRSREKNNFHFGTTWRNQNLSAYNDIDKNWRIK